MEYQLVVVRGRSSSSAIKLGDGVTTVGRHDDCQLRIKSTQVSRRHCELFEKKGLLLVKDLGSSNGTFVNGKRIKDQRVLEPGDELTVGQVQLKVVKINAGAVPAAAAPTPATKPSDTAVVPAASLSGPATSEPSSVPMDDDFDIEFDELPLPPGSEPTTTAPASAPSPSPSPSPAAAQAKPETPEEPEPAGEAGDAIADFLLDIKLDDES